MGIGRNTNKKNIIENNNKKFRFVNCSSCFINNLVR